MARDNTGKIYINQNLNLSNK